MTPDQELHSKFKILEQFQGFDASLLKVLADETSPQVTLQMLKAFSQTVSTEVLHIESALMNHDFVQLKKGFHKLAGTSELLGFPEHGKRWRKLSHELEKGLNLEVLPAELDEIKSLQKILDEAMNRNEV